MAPRTSKFDKPWILALLLITSTLEMFLAGCTIAGYSSLLIVFQKLGFYHQLCTRNIKTANLNETTTSTFGDEICNDQKKALNLLYVIGFAFTSLCKFPLGYLIDRYGVQICNFVGW